MCLEEEPLLRTIILKFVDFSVQRKSYWPCYTFLRSVRRGDYEYPKISIRCLMSFPVSYGESRPRTSLEFRIKFSQRRTSKIENTGLK